MGGLRTRLPFAFVAMLIGVLAICGVPGFSGFFSKDAVVYGALETGHPWLYAVGVITAGITAYYMFRLLFVTFFGALSRRRRSVATWVSVIPSLAGTAASRGTSARSRRAAPSRAAVADVGAGRGADPADDPHRLARLRRRERSVEALLRRILPARCRGRRRTSPIPELAVDRARVGRRVRSASRSRTRATARAAALARRGRAPAR